MEEQDRKNQIDKLLRRLPGEVNEALLGDIFDDCLSIALAKSNRQHPTEPLLVITRDAVLCAWNQLGDEGTKNSSCGGQSFSYEDIGEKMFKEIVGAGLRVIGW